jgi:hypothetical protein
MDELLDEQARFLASKNLPAAAVTRRKEPSENESPKAMAEPKPGRPLSKFAASRAKQSTPAESRESESRIFAEPMSLVSLNIVERNANSVPVTAPEFRSTPFPVITKHKPDEKKVKFSTKGQTHEQHLQNQPETKAGPKLHADKTYYYTQLINSISPGEHQNTL